MLSFVIKYEECSYAECHYAHWHANLCLFDTFHFTICASLRMFVKEKQTISITTTDAKSCKAESTEFHNKE
jgi:hypothetical protein